MSFQMQPLRACSVMLLATALTACDEEPAKEPGAETKAATTAASAALQPAPEPAVSAEPPPKPRDDCPEGSSGIGTSKEPCAGSGTSRMLEVKYSGKTTEKGPKFSVTNLTDKPILHGSISVYFYDKAGKQLDVTSGDKTRPKQNCSGNIFAGHIQPKEKIWVFFSCVKKEHVPEGTQKIEAEARMVGFADESGKENEFFWKNADLTPDERPLGGIKAGKK